MVAVYDVRFAWSRASDLIVQTIFVFSGVFYNFSHTGDAHVL
jgi:hypothetical protein